MGSSLLRDVEYTGIVTYRATDKTRQFVTDDDVIRVRDDGDLRVWCNAIVALQSRTAESSSARRGQQRAVGSRQIQLLTTC